MNERVLATAIQRFVANHQPGAAPPDAQREQRLRELLRHAVKHVPLYGDLYRARGVSIESITDPDDLWRVPAMTKSDFVRAGEASYTDERLILGNLHTQHTSGSLGGRLTIYATEVETLYQLAGLWAGWVGMGVTSRDRLFMMSAPYLAEKVEPFQSLFIPVQMPTEEVVREFQNFRPTVIIGMVEAIALLALELQRRNISARDEVRLLFPFGQTYSAQLRRMVESGFSGEAFVLYGSAEVGWLGIECEQHNGLHVPGRCIVHVSKTGNPDDPAGENETGEIIATSLLRETTPFIRYRLNDAGAFDLTPCPCGRNSPRLTNLEGRVQDFLLSLDGQWVGPGSIAIDLIVDQPKILDHRVVQETPDRVRVSLVALNFETADRQRVESVVRKRLGPVKIDIDLVDEIPRDPSGKRRRIYRMFDLPEA
jgi:phenylacetate-CoA ligase